MKIDFRKMNGAGNDFVMIDETGGSYQLSAEQIRHVCDRRRGVGADGLILIQPDEELDFFMQYFNSDGLPAEMCGNGARCSAHFAAWLGMGRKEGGEVKIRFSTGSGPVKAVVKDLSVSVDLMDANEMRRDITAEVAQKAEKIHFMVVGTRHALVLVEDARSLTGEEVVAMGRQVRYHEAFAPVGANVNFISRGKDDRIHLRTYEKGIEAETHACGTGSVASAVLLAHLGRAQSPVTVVQSGGELFRVSFELRPYGATNVVLEGPVAVNFDGSIDL